jgi:hypothetical protein
MLNDMVAAFTASSKIGEAMQEQNKTVDVPAPPPRQERPTEEQGLGEDGLE